MRPPRLPPVIVPPDDDPYSLGATYLAQIPWNGSAGPWGGSVPVQQPATPVTTSSTTVHNITDLRTQCAIGGKVVTLGTSVPRTEFCALPADDTDVVIPLGIQGPSFNFHNGPSRVRIRGSTPGVAGTGGTVEGLQMSSFGGDPADSATDLIVDGVQLQSGDYNAWVLAGLRFGLYNVRALAGGGAIISDARHLTIKRCNFFGGAMTRAEVTAYAGGGDPPGWALRQQSGPFYIVDSDLRNTRFVVLRTHPDSGTAANHLMFVAGSRLVNYAEGRGWYFWNGSAAAYGGIVRDSELYSYSECGWTEDITLGSNVAYTRIINVAFRYGGDVTYSQAYLNSVAASQAGDHDYTVGNTFAPWTPANSTPAWDRNSTGSPEALALPSPYVFSYGEGACVGFPNA